jgi:hypothetical protein
MSPTGSPVEPGRKTLSPGLKVEINPDNIMAEPY